MAGVGELVQSTTGEWMVRPPQHCLAGHRLPPGRMLVGNIACSFCGRHTPAATAAWSPTGPNLGDGCSLLDGPARVHNGKLLYDADKLRLDGTPTPGSRVARNDEAARHHVCG
jgi:hypothetical protein